MVALFLLRSREHLLAATAALLSLPGNRQKFTGCACTRRPDAVGGKRLPGAATRPRPEPAAPQTLPKRTARQAILAVLAAAYDVSHKQISVGAGFEPYKLSKTLNAERLKELPDETFEKL